MYRSLEIDAKNLFAFQRHSSIFADVSIERAFYRNGGFKSNDMLLKDNVVT